MDKNFTTGAEDRMVIQTSDCIQIYCQLKSQGISFIKEPGYTSKGLSADFIDPFGNIYSILEERNYDNSYLFADEIR